MDTTSLATFCGDPCGEKRRLEHRIADPVVMESGGGTSVRPPITSLTKGYVRITMGWFGKRDERKRQAVTVPFSAAEPHKADPFDATPTVSQYVAPSPVQKSATPALFLEDKSPVIQPADLEEEDMVVVDNRRVIEDDYGDVENPSSTTDSRNDESEPEAYNNESSQKNNHLNSLFNGHLMKWKIEAEEGTSFVRVPACKR